MEICSFYSTPYYCIVNIRRNVTGKCLISNQAMLPILKEKRLCSGFDVYGVNKNRNRRSFTIAALKGFDSLDSNLLSESYNSDMVDGKVGTQDVAGRGKSVPKVMIPSLPSETKGDSVAAVDSCLWEWKPKLNVHYEKSGCQNVNSAPILFLPGFGVGSFHYEKQLKDLGRDYRIWALDFIGQGKSLPCEDPTSQPKRLDESAGDGNNVLWGFGDEAEPWAKELVYSVDLWRDQVRYFIEEVIKEPVYIVGNSLGGYVALYFAAYYPELVKGVTLLNATPFWGFLPNPVRSPRLSRLFPWAGTFPLPTTVKKLTEIAWQKISAPESIAEVLKQVYADHTTKVDKVFSSILEVTEHPAAAAALASIMFAPQGQLNFKEALTGCRMNNVPLCLIYGKEDPWVRPIWGLQVKRQFPEAPYYQISPAGHCPHDEVPEIVNFLLRGWVKNVESNSSVALPLLDSPESVEYDVVKDLEFVRQGMKKSARVQFYGSMTSQWERLAMFLKSRFPYGVYSP
ncbi:hypothetical protein HAX54_042370 [Datura stramonium]|uniref:AB hydrolase-1 domain-containing protein n=1 Tax=Datura stramonium TaxID=4076 RepID=A0ABS8W0N4_DATST|nr:hypothetical protein [Datura stramonium]